MINSSSKGDSEASRKLSLLTERLTVEKLTIYAMMNGDKNCVAKPKFKYLNQKKNFFALIRKRQLNHSN